MVETFYPGGVDFEQFMAALARSADGGEGVLVAIAAGGEVAVGTVSISEIMVLPQASTEEQEPIPPPGRWHFPVGTDEYPPDQWYIATAHDLTGEKNGGYKHTGIDYNLEIPPRGDVDLGFPVFAVTDGIVHGTWWSEKNRGSVVIKVGHNGMDLWVRYLHLAKDEKFLRLVPGMYVTGGAVLGHLGDYPPGPTQGAHLHFDMALDPFHPGAWFSQMDGTTRWVDPVEVLKMHLPPEVVEASLRVG